ncbi:glycosyltransferase family 2 protein [Yaniella halotolerans]|uniref:glycosyltransferase family 2 protein n=1 Tax=Yaniella halotolerans TaxID=225453 RepID=UPI0003B389B1|nr:glycosyltransferase family A protein [Yaniella halotolerans]
MFAKVASQQSLNLADLLTVIENQAVVDLSNEHLQLLQSEFDGHVLLALADLLANTAQDDLDLESAVQIYGFVTAIFSDPVFADQSKLLYVEALSELGQHDAAIRFAEKFEIDELAPLQKELLKLQRIGRSEEVLDAWLEALNLFYVALDMSEVALLNDQTVPLLDRLTAKSSRGIDGPKVSVIMPTYSPGPGIKTALRSLLQQSWKNLEIIVVNDASPEAYEETFRAIEVLDPRIQVIHQTDNAGAYVARNTGLAVATGDFVTTHDDDDWSHPDKIATQVNFMRENPSVVATTSAHIRTTEDLEFRRVNIHAKFLQTNYSSLLFRRSTVSTIGGWDTVNRGGDAEFYTRLIEYFGDDRVVALVDRPLSFSRIWKGSLTSGEMSRGRFAYSRLLYRWAFRQWHWDSKKAGRNAVRMPGDIRPYPVPTSFEPGQRDNHRGFYDVIYVTDFARQAQYVDYALQDMQALASAGLRVGYMHLQSPENIQPSGMPKLLAELQLGEQISQISEVDNAETRLLLVYGPSIGMFADRANSKIVSHRGLVVERKLATLSGSEQRSAYYLRTSLQNLDAAFDTEFDVVGATAADQSRLRRSIGRGRVLPDSMTWSTHINEYPAMVVPPSEEPVVGFHSYGNQYRWPSNVAAFKSVFHSEDFKTRFMGNLDAPIKKFGSEVFRDAEIVDASQTSLADFLADIDFWVYWPHGRLEEDVWEPVLHAMCSGKVVILPKRYSSVYGQAAVYADIEEIADVVARLQRDPVRYTAQAEQGQKFVRAQYTDENFIERVTAILGSGD